MLLQLMVTFLKLSYVPCRMEDKLLQETEQRFQKGEATFEEYANVFTRQNSDDSSSELHRLPTYELALGYGLYKLASKFMVITEGTGFKLDEKEMDDDVPYASMQFDGHTFDAPGIKCGILYEPSDNLVLSEQWNNRIIAPTSNSLEKRAKFIEDFFEIQASHPDSNNQFDLGFSDITNSRSRVYFIEGMERIPARLIALAKGGPIASFLLERIRKLSA